MATVWGRYFGDVCPTPYNLHLRTIFPQTQWSMKMSLFYVMLSLGPEMDGVWASENRWDFDTMTESCQFQYLKGVRSKVRKSRSKETFCRERRTKQVCGEPRFWIQRGQWDGRGGWRQSLSAEGLSTARFPSSAWVLQLDDVQAQLTVPLGNSGLETQKGRTGTERADTL